MIKEGGIIINYQLYHILLPEKWVFDKVYYGMLHK